MEKEAIKHRFLQYAASFKNGIKEVDINVQLKMDHTLRVLEEAEHLAHEENFSEKEVLTDDIISSEKVVLGLRLLKGVEEEYFTRIKIR